MNDNGHNDQCRYPTLSALCPACARLWAEQIAREPKE